MSNLLNDITKTNRNGGVSAPNKRKTGMDINVYALFMKTRNKLWIPILLAVILAYAGWSYAGRIQPTPYADTTLITLDVDRSTILGYQTTLDDVTTSNRMAISLLGVIYSHTATRAAAQTLNSDYGIQIDADYLGAMISVTTDSSSASILHLKARSGDPSLVVPVANAMAQSFVDTLYSLTGSTYVSVLDPAEYVMYTAGGNTKMYGTAGALVGLIAGAAIIYLALIMDNRIRSAEDLKRVAGAGRITIIPLHNIK